mmetsp:Transcript_34025/g.79688  ORF Transcript_34025/g.79688 Transcript_34025/m.79688 type:complete len:201 (-) Transcript_34025:1427-2029(-)
MPLFLPLETSTSRPDSFIARRSIAATVPFPARATAPVPARSPRLAPFRALEVVSLAATVRLPTTGPATFFTPDPTKRPARPASAAALPAASLVTEAAVEVAPAAAEAAAEVAPATARADFPPASRAAEAAFRRTLVALAEAALTVLSPRSSGVSNPRRRVMATGPRISRLLVSVAVGTVTVDQASILSKMECTTSTGWRQ